MAYLKCFTGSPCNRCQRNHRLRIDSQLGVLDQVRVPVLNNLPYTLWIEWGSATVQLNYLSNLPQH